MRSPIPRTAGQRLSQSCLLLWKFCLSTFWRPLNASQFLWQLLWVNRVNERHVGLGLCAGQKFKFLRPTHDEPEHVGFGIVEHLTQLVWPNEHPAMLRHSQCLVAHTDSPHSFQDEIEFFCPDMLVERVGANSVATAKALLQDSRSWFAPKNPRLEFSSSQRDANGGRPA